ncbi:hypothetical protein ACFWUV_37695, partial [Streptomyces sp. NPDC058657]
APPGAERAGKGAAPGGAEQCTPPHPDPAQDPAPPNQPHPTPPRPGGHSKADPYANNPRNGNTALRTPNTA